MTRNRSIKTFESKLKAVDSRVNKGLFIVICVVIFASQAIDRYSLNSSAVSLLFIVTLVAYLAFGIMTTIKGKAKVAKEFGVVCSVCGKTPKAFFMVQAMKNEKCPYCGGDMLCKTQ